MNKFYPLIILLIMFLSCGNSSSEFFGPKNNEKLIPATIYHKISKEQKIMAEKLDALFSDFYNSGTFNGSVIIAKAGRIIYQRSMGYSDKESKFPLSDTSMFQLASVSKVITATAVLMLQERELLDINKKFSFYFPSFPYKDVTVKDLLNHRSGLPNYIYTLNKEIYLPNYQMNNTDMYNYFISKNAKPYMKPNTRFNYCNTNYALLGLLIEKISGKAFQTFLKEELFEPLGMRHTATIRDIDLNGLKTAKPYDTRWRPINFDASDFVLGDKSIYSTPYDLFLFSEALYQNRIISPKTQEMAYTAFSKEKKISNYGLGWRMKDFNDPKKKEVYHNGWWHGYRSSFHRRLKDTLTVVILSNQLNRSVYQTGKVYQIIDGTNGEEPIDEDE